MPSAIMVKIGSGNGLLPYRWQAITWTNADSLSIGPLGTKLIRKEIWIYLKIPNFCFKKDAFTKVVCKMAAIFSHLSVLTDIVFTQA